MLEIKNVSSGYGKTEVIKNVSLNVEKSKLVSIIGPNGCGKSTLFKTVLGILPNIKGQIIVDSVDASVLKPKEKAKRIAYLSQGMNMADMTVEQLVLHGRFPYIKYPKGYSFFDKQVAQNAMKKMGVFEYAHNPLSSLSGGMRQKVYIAMALAQDSDYILLDEPTTYLDILHQLNVIKGLKTLSSSGKGIIMIMHDILLALNFSDEIIIMDKGRIILKDSPEKIYDKRIIKDIFGIEIGLTIDGSYCYKY